MSGPVYAPLVAKSIRWLAPKEYEPDGVPGALPPAAEPFVGAKSLPPLVQTRSYALRTPVA
jgi:hypothetical protein